MVLFVFVLVFLCFSLLCTFYFICMFFFVLHMILCDFVFICFHLMYIYYNIFYNKIVSIFFFCVCFLSKIKPPARERVRVCVCVCLRGFCFIIVLLPLALIINKVLSFSICFHCFVLITRANRKNNEKGKTRKTIHIKNQ